MAENHNYPREYDAVAGGGASFLADSAVLGGIEGVKRVMKTGTREDRAKAVARVVEYGEAGLQVAIASLKITQSKCS